MSPSAILIDKRLRALLFHATHRLFDMALAHLGIWAVFLEPSHPIAKLYAELTSCEEIRRERLAQFDETPIAAASMGQVHRGVLPSERSKSGKGRSPPADARRLLRLISASVFCMVCIVAVLVVGVQCGQAIQLENG